MAASATTAGIPETTLYLAQLRASQINGRGFCIDAGAKNVTKAGMSPEKLSAVAAWYDSGLFDDAERAALALTEAVTLVAETHVPSTVIDEAARLFPPEALTEIVYAIIEINAWNRLAITTGAPEPGSYQADGSGL